MPEGHTIHRLAAEHERRFAGRRLRASSPQGRFQEGAALIDGRELTATEAHGKHLFLGFLGAEGAGPAEGAELDEPATGAGWVHVHLGLIGRYDFGDPPAPGEQPPPPADTVRLRLEHPLAGHSDLRGPALCTLITDAEKQAVQQRLGPDPLRPADLAQDPANDPDRAYRRISRSRLPVAALLLDQKVLAGVGNVYRAEVLFRHGLDPYLPGRQLPYETWQSLWADLVALMHEGVELNRIDTVRPEHTPEAMNRPPRQDDHGGEVYVYRRAGDPCLVCGTPVAHADLSGRNLFWCPTCQPKA
ncbi:Fpg/Nei family DNA glycosylase [Phaeacidiphilus oryzae]|uniref:Fpg/Nei family DNA glycosylase n=1 Tax=Phaeacidiphilus oryzae TaxID=348818 RepID=UPI00056B260D|nr:DNA-formamidopyrimidine glycosylase family protein [Phaeacidiphilus oryzae]